MILGRVIGNVVSSAKDPALNGIKLLVVQPIGRDGNAKGRAIVALDSVGAGVGETVYWCRGKEASFPFFQWRFLPRLRLLASWMKSISPTRLSVRRSSGEC